MARKTKDYSNCKNPEWHELCTYVKKEILCYDDNMKLPNYMILKLRGLKKGQHIANNNIKANACYDDYTILCAFKLCKAKIVDYLTNNESKINDETHRINIIIKIVESEINDVYIRLQQKKNREDIIKTTSYDNQFAESAEYTRQTKDTSEKLKKLF